MDGFEGIDKVAPTVQSGPNVQLVHTCRLG
jgi:hypothetical protein